METGTNIAGCRDYIRYCHEATLRLDTVALLVWSLMCFWPMSMSYWKNVCGSHAPSFAELWSATIQFQVPCLST